MIVRKRGTAIVENSKGVIVASGKRKLFLLPGGGSNKQESRMNATIRELKEETGLNTLSCEYLFTHHEPRYPEREIRNLHKVFLIKTFGNPVPSHHDVKYIDFWTPNSNVNISDTTRDIINRYLKYYKLYNNGKTLLEDYPFNKCQNMFLGIAFGDAFGAGYEMKSRKEISKKLLLNKYNRKKHKWKKGFYTDDTQMSIAVAELLISDKEFNKINLADKFVEVYKRNPHSGYGSNTKKAIKRSTGEKLLKTISELIPEGSIRNGACMRAVPIGIIPNLKKVIKYAKINAEVTHNSPKGITSSVIVAVASYYFYYKLGSKEKFLDFCINACKGLDKESIEYFKSIRDMKHFDPKLLFGEDKADFGVPCDGMRTAGAILYILSKYVDNPNKALIESVLLGGDVDSVASVAVGISCMNKGIKDLPPFLFYDLENKRFGRDYLLDLGENLFKKYPYK